MARPVDHALTDDRSGLPLAGSAIEAQVAVGRDTLAVLDDAHSALVPLGIIVVGEHHVEPGHLEILEVVKRELRRLGRGQRHGDEPHRTDGGQE